MKKMHQKSKIENDMRNYFSKERKRREEIRKNTGELVAERRWVLSGLVSEMFVGIPGIKRYTEAY